MEVEKLLDKFLNPLNTCKVKKVIFLISAQSNSSNDSIVPSKSNEEIPQSTVESSSNTGDDSNDSIVAKSKKKMPFENINIEA